MAASQFFQDSTSRAGLGGVLGSGAEFIFVSWNRLHFIGTEYIFGEVDASFMSEGRDRCFREPTA